MSDLQHMPGHLIRRLQQAAVAIFHEEVAKHGIDLTPVQFAALAQVAEKPGLDQITLARLIAHDRTTIAGVVDRLVQKNFISRETNPTDRRAKILQLTSAGAVMVQAAMPVVEEAQHIILQGLDAHEREVLLSLLAKAAAAVNDLSRAPLKSG